MDLQTFESEADRLSRRCTIFCEDGPGSPAAYWHGVRPGLCLSIFHDRQWLNIFLHDDCVSGHVETSVAPNESTTPLFARSYSSLPPIDGIFLRGTDLIGEYLRQLDWPRDEPFNDSFPDPIPSNYERLWQENCPLYHSDIAVMSGGWHMPWPDGDWYDLVDSELVAWTFLEAEPWVEAFKQDSEYIVNQRIT